MTKPTLVQSLLNRPSQTYSGPNAPRKEYYSTKQEMLRIAAEEAAKRPNGERSGLIEPEYLSVVQRGEESDSDIEVFFTPNTSPRTSMVSTGTARRKLSRRSLSSTDSVKIAPKPAPQAIMAVPSTRTPSTSTTNYTSTHDRHSNLSISSTTLDSHSLFSDDAPDRSEGEREVTYNKDESGRWRNQKYADEEWAKDVRWLVSPPSSSSNPTKAQLTSTVKPKPVANERGRSTTPTAPQVSPTTKKGPKVNSYAHLGVASISTAIGEPVSKNSSLTATPSTPNQNSRGKEPKKPEIPRPIVSSTVPSTTNATADTKRVPASQSVQQSQPQRQQRQQPHTFSAFASIPTPDSNSGGSSSTTATISISKPHPLSSSNVNGNGRQPSSKHLPQGHRSGTATIGTATSPKVANTLTSTSTMSRVTPGHVHPSSTSSIPAQNNDRPKPTSTSDSKKTRSSQSASHTTNSSSTSTTKHYRSSNPSPSSSPSPPLTNSSKSNTPPPIRNRNPKPKPIPNITGMSGMSALIEEDEEGPLTPRMNVRGFEYGSSSSSSRQEGYDATSASGGGSSQGGVNSTSGTSDRSRSLRHTSKPDALRRRRSRSLDSLTDSQHSSSHSASTVRKPPQTLQSEVNALVSTFSPPGERPSKGTQGYTSLVLPRAPAPMGTAAVGAYADGGALGAGVGGWLSLSPNGKIDLTRSGIAQTTMATVEVVRGLGASRGAGLFGLFGRKRSLSSGTGPPGPLPLPLSGAGTKRASADAGVPSGVASGLSAPPVTRKSTSPLGFTSYRSPPNHVPSGSVMVQVWAVGLDGIDGKLVGVRFGAEEGMAVSHRSQRERRRQENAGQETEREEEETEQEDEEEWRENEETDQEFSTSQTNPSTLKGPLAALGRSLSQRLSRGTSTKRKGKEKEETNGHANTPINTKTNHTDALERSKTFSPPKRSLSFSLKRSNTSASRASSGKPASPSVANQNPSSSAKKSPKSRIRAGLGYIPGRSFVGRVLECGWDVRDEVVRKGEWVVGLLDVRKGGALSEFIVVDRRRVHRVPHPWKSAPPAHDPVRPVNPVWIASPTATQQDINSPSTLTLEELALLPLCGLPAYRSIRTFIFAFSSIQDRPAPGSVSSVDRRAAGFDYGSSIAPSSQSDQQPHSRSTADHDQSYRRRALVLRGHDGTGAMAVQLLVQRGWRVSVHVPFSSVPSHASQEVGDAFMRVIEERARVWGADEVIFDDGEEGGGADDGRGAAVRVLDTLREDGDIFDAILDTIGGKEVREAGERLLRSQGFAKDDVQVPQRRGVGQFTTLVGDVPRRVIPSAADNFRAGLRSFRLGGSQTQDSGSHGVAPNSAVDDEANLSPAKGNGRVGYAWVSVAQDVDWEGDDVGETLGIVVRLALEDGIRPIVEDIEGERVVPFEGTPAMFVDDGPLRDGGTVVVKVAG